VANEISVSVSVTAAKGNAKVAQSKSFKADWNTARRTSGTQNIGTEAEQLVLSADIATAGVGIFSNLDSANPVLLGVVAGALSTPAAPTVTPQGTTGGTSYSYRIAAIDAYGKTLASTAGTTSTGNATLNGTNFNRVTWSAVTGATGYKVYGRASGSELLLATLGAVTTYDDTGAATPSGALPVLNTTGFQPFAKLVDGETFPIRLATTTLYAVATVAAVDLDFEILAD